MNTSRNNNQSPNQLNKSFWPDVECYLDVEMKRWDCLHIRVETHSWNDFQTSKHSVIKYPLKQHFLIFCRQYLNDNQLLCKADKQVIFFHLQHQKSINSVYELRNALIRFEFWLVVELKKNPKTHTFLHLYRAWIMLASNSMSLQRYSTSQGVPKARDLRKLCE